MKRWMDGWMDVSMRACLLAATSYLSCSLVALRQHSGQGALYSSMYTNQMYLTVACKAIAIHAPHLLLGRCAATRPCACPSTAGLKMQYISLEPALHV